jgi:hypothetical protein
MKSEIDRLLSRVDIDPETGCWLWTGYRMPDGYGQIARPQNGGRERTHRYSWEIHNGPIPAGIHVLHRCDNPPCCNPAHLFLGTNVDNVADKVAKGRQSRLGTGRRGEAHASAKLTDEQVRHIHRREMRGADYAELYGVHRWHVYAIQQGRSRAAAWQSPDR